MRNQDGIRFTKRVGNIYELICDRDNLKDAIYSASKRKRNRKQVRFILNNIDQYVDRLEYLLKAEEYTPAPYRMKECYDGIQKKKRLIAQPKFFPDQCIHHALIQVLGIVIEHGMYEYCCGSIPGRGVHKAKKAIERWIRSDPKNTKYVLKMDIRKFYPSISHDALKVAFRRKLKDQKALRLIDTIIDSYSPGIPIGNYTSQWFCNFALQDMDHFIKEKMGVKYYVRYIDDMVCFGSNKKKLHALRIAIANKLDGMSLCIKNNWQVFPLKSRALDFLGFKFYRGKTTIRKSIALKIRRKAKRVYNSKNITPHNAAAMLSYMGWVKHSDSGHFWKIYVHPYINLSELKGVIANASRKQHQAKQQL